MTVSRLSYALISPVRNEATNLERLARALRSQTHLPTEWVIVDNGSDDSTGAVARRLTDADPWIRVTSIPGETQPTPGAPIVRAFHAGLRELATQPDIVVKLDADTSMDTNHFEGLAAAFRDDASLGIASGNCLELNDEGKWGPVPVTAGHVRGAVRAYRRACLQEVLPLEERVGWDGIDELKAAVLGWKTRILPDLAFYHHRPLGARDVGRGARWRAQGSASHYMGYRFSYLVLRSLHHARRDPVALAMISSYLAAAIRREPRFDDPAVRRYLRTNQSLRFLRSRAREALGKTTSS